MSYSARTTTVLTEDLWSALDALDAVPEAQQTEWYKRLEEAADAATHAILLEKGLITEQQAQNVTFVTFERKPYRSAH